MYFTPFIINESGETELLERVPFGSGFSENWLQNRLVENPQALPLQEIDPAYQQVCPLCMEMSTAAGPIDVVYITPQGRLVIIETKLWRNPEARRKFVGVELPRLYLTHRFLVTTARQEYFNKSSSTFTLFPLVKKITKKFCRAWDLARIIKNQAR